MQAMLSTPEGKSCASRDLKLIFVILRETRTCRQYLTLHTYFLYQYKTDLLVVVFQSCNKLRNRSRLIGKCSVLLHGNSQSRALTNAHKAAYTAILLLPHFFTCTLLRQPSGECGSANENMFDKIGPFLRDMLN